MFKGYNTGQQIKAKFDGAIWNTFAGQKDYIIKDIGDEFDMLYQAGSLDVTVGTGIAIIGGRGMVAEESNSITLDPNTTTYLCLRIDLTQLGDQVFSLYASPSAAIQQGNLNEDANAIRDLLLAKIDTNASDITALQDLRVIQSTAGSGFDFEVDEIANMQIAEEVSFEFGEEISTIATSDNTVATASYVGRTITVVGVGAGTCNITINGTKVIPVSVIS